MARQQIVTPGIYRPSLHLELFEGPALQRRENTVPTSPLQDCLLSVVFAWGADRVPRKKVQDLLWDSGPDKSVRHRLSQLVYQVNRKCGARILELHKDRIFVNRREVSCDYETFGRMIESRQFERAYELVRRGFLSVLGATRTRPLHDWLGEKRRELRGRLESATRAYLEAPGPNRDSGRISAAGRVLKLLNPDGAVGRRRASNAAVASGHVREADSSYGVFDAASPRLEADGGGVHGGTGAGDAERRAVFVGRMAEGEQLSDAVLGSGRPSGWQTIAIVGDEGVGKTWFVEPVLRQARFAGMRVATASATALESRIPLNLLLEPLNNEWVRPLVRDIRDPWKATIQSLIPRFQDEGEWNAGMPHTATDTVSRRTCEALLELFRRVAKRGRTVLFLDNFHWTDESTRTVLDFIIRRWGSDAFTLVVAYRPEALGPTGRASATGILSFDPNATIIRLDALDAGEARQLVEVQSANRLPAAAMDRIVDLAGGNPRFLADLTVAWAAEAPRTLDHTLLPAPPSIRRALDWRLQHLSEQSRVVASCLSVFGVTATLPDVVRLSNVVRADCVRALEELHSFGLLDWSRAGVEFRYRVFGAALYERLSPPRRHQLHTRAAELLRGQVDRGPVGRIALHYFWAGQRDRAYEFATAALKRAPCPDIDKRLAFLTLARDASDGLRRRTAALELVRLNRRTGRLGAAMERANELLGDTDGLREIEIGELRLIAADAGHRLGLAPTGRTLDEFAAIERRAHGRRYERLRAAVLDATVQLLDRTGDREAVVEQQARIAALRPMLHPAARSRVFSALSTAASRSDPHAAARLARRAVRAARKATGPDELSLALQRLVVALAGAGRLGTEYGRRSLKEARMAHDHAGNTGAFALALLHLTAWQTTTSLHGAAEDTLREAAALVRHMDCPETRTLEALVRGGLALAKGDVEATEASLRRAFGIVGAARETGRPAPPVPETIILALTGLEGNVLLESGKFGLASQVEELAPLPGLLHEAPLDLILFHSRMASRRGDIAAAVDFLEGGIAAAEGVRPLVWLRLVLELVRLARRSARPRPDLAARAHATAHGFGLPVLAHEFLPFLRRSP